MSECCERKIYVKLKKIFWYQNVYNILPIPMYKKKHITDRK